MCHIFAPNTFGGLCVSRLSDPARFKGYRCFFCFETLSVFSDLPLPYSRDSRDPSYDKGEEGASMLKIIS